MCAPFCVQTINLSIYLSISGSSLMAKHRMWQRNGHIAINKRLLALFFLLRLDVVFYFSVCFRPPNARAFYSYCFDTRMNNHLLAMFFSAIFSFVRLIIILSHRNNRVLCRKIKEKTKEKKQRINVQLTISRPQYRSACARATN